MKIVKRAKLFNLHKIWQIRKLATKNLQANKVDQWQFRDPTYFSFVKDIILRRLYVLKANQEIVGIMMLNTKEPTYKEIVGMWSSADDYIVVHKLAVKYVNKGYATILLKYAEHVAKLNKILYIRIDTHEDNKKMINLLLKLKYNYCGVITLNLKKGNNKRIAYDKKVI